MDSTWSFVGRRARGLATLGDTGSSEIVPSDEQWEDREGTPLPPTAPYRGDDEFALPGVENVAAHLRGMVTTVEGVPAPVDANSVDNLSTTVTDGSTPDAVPPSPAQRQSPSPVETVQLRDDVPAVDSPHWREVDDRPLPAQFEAIRPWQWDAVQTIVEEFASGCDVVLLDAPTGAGKTLIAELTRRVMPDRVIRQGKQYRGGTYICHSKSLQAQFVGDFRYSDLLMGRDNYTPVIKAPGVTCGDCTKNPDDDPPECEWCPNVHECSYEIAKRNAIRSRLAVLNTAYFMSECNYVGKMSDRAFSIMDECDVAESEIMGFHEFFLGDRTLSRLGIDAPKKGVHKQTILAWFEDELVPAVDREMGTLPHRSTDVRVIRRRNTLERLRQDAWRVGARLKQELDDEDAVAWIRDNDAGPLVLKPVRVDDVADRTFLRHSHNWLMMSATIISPGQMAEDLGFAQARDGKGIKWASVEVPMTFPVENRPIYAVPVADMAAKNKATAWPIMADAIGVLLRRYPTDNVLVHAVSYELTRYLVEKLRQTTMRPIHTYDSAGGRDAAIEGFRRGTGGVMVAPSLDRGVDFRDDDCRVVIVAKLPFPYLGDKQVSARLYGRGGKAWYAVQTVRSIVQMTGRATRSMDDWSHVYILDSQFRKNTWRNHRGLFPKWWRDAVDMVTVAPRDLRLG